jgi:hypothetical protein
MNVPIKSKDGIETYMVSIQSLDWDDQTGLYTMNCFLVQKDGKDFQNPEQIVLKVELDQATSVSITDSVVNAFNK